MVNAISGGPAPTGLETSQHPHQLPHGPQQARTASMAAANASTPATDPALAERPAVYGTAGSLQAHETAARYDAKKKLPAPGRGDEKIPPRNKPHDHKGRAVDVDA